MVVVCQLVFLGQKAGEKQICTDNMVNTGKMGHQVARLRESVRIIPVCATSLGLNVLEVSNVQEAKRRSMHGHSRMKSRPAQIESPFLCPRPVGDTESGFKWHKNSKVTKVSR